MKDHDATILMTRATDSQLMAIALASARTRTAVCKCRQRPLYHSARCELARAEHDLDAALRATGLEF